MEHGATIGKCGTGRRMTGARLGIETCLGTNAPGPKSSYEACDSAVPRGLGLRRRDFRQLQRLLTPLAQRALQAALRRKTTGMVLFNRPPPKLRPALQKTQPQPPRASPTKSRAPKRPAGQKATPGPPRGSPGVPRKWCYWDTLAPFHRQHPSGSLGSRAGIHRGAARAPPGEPQLDGTCERRTGSGKGPNAQRPA
jgi:hypothetical protein